MTAGDYIGYFAHLVEKGQMTEEEAAKQLEELHKIDMMQDEIDRWVVACHRTGSVLTKEQTDRLFTLAERPIEIEFS
jgi:hypothetical protein